MATVISGGPDNPTLLLLDAVSVAASGLQRTARFSVDGFDVVAFNVTSDRNFYVYAYGGGADGPMGVIYAANVPQQAGEIQGSADAVAVVVDVRAFTRCELLYYNTNPGEAATVTAYAHLGR